MNIDQLKALTAFIEGLTDLSLQTGITLHSGRTESPYLDIDGEYLDLVIGTDGDGNATYGVTRADLS